MQKKLAQACNAFSYIMAWPDTTDLFGHLGRFHSEFVTDQRCVKKWNGYDCASVSYELEND